MPGGLAMKEDYWSTPSSCVVRSSATLGASTCHAIPLEEFRCPHGSHPLRQAPLSLVPSREGPKTVPRQFFKEVISVKMYKMSQSGTEQRPRLALPNLRGLEKRV